MRQVAVDLGINLNTIAGAYRELQAEGLVTIRHGSGAVVASRTTSTKDTGELRKPSGGPDRAGRGRRSQRRDRERELRALTKR